MFENIWAKLRKRRRLDEDADGGDNVDHHGTSSGSAAAASMFASGLPTQSNITMFWDSLFGANNEASNTAAYSNQTEQHAQRVSNLNNNNSYARNNLPVPVDR